MGVAGGGVKGKGGKGGFLYLPNRRVHVVGEVMMMMMMKKEKKKKSSSHDFPLQSDLPQLYSYIATIIARIYTPATTHPCCCWASFSYFSLLLSFFLFFGVWWIREKDLLNIVKCTKRIPKKKKENLRAFFVVFGE